MAEGPRSPRDQGSATGLAHHAQPGASFSPSTSPYRRSTGWPNYDLRSALTHTNRDSSQNKPSQASDGQHSRRPRHTNTHDEGHSTSPRHIAIPRPKSSHTVTDTDTTKRSDAIQPCHDQVEPCSHMGPRGTDTGTQRPYMLPTAHRGGLSEPRHATVPRHARFVVPTDHL